MSIGGLSQHRFLRGSRSFSVGEDRRITVSHKTAFSRQEYQVGLDELDGSVVRVKYAKYSNLVAAIIFLLMALGIAWVMFDDNTLADLWHVPLLASSPGLLLALAYWRSIDDLVILRRNDGTNALVLFARSPSASMVEDFVSRICRAVADRDASIRDARTSIRSLHDLGVISGEEARALSDRLSVKLRPVG